MKAYVGNPLQIRGAEQYTLQGGKGNGMRFIYVRNGLGLDAWISLDRCADISRVSYKGVNYAFMSPCGYVAPQYYNPEGKGFLDSFTAGFFTTCGLTAVGAPCVDEGEKLPMHGTVSNIPATLTRLEEDERGLTIEAAVRDGVLFGKKLLLKRKYFISYTESSIKLADTVINEGDCDSPFMILYHCNMGYPLLCEESRIEIPHTSISPQDKNAADNMETAAYPEAPQARIAERCYYYDVTPKDGRANVGIYNGKIEKGLVISYDKSTLPCFTEWKMMGKTDYVLGLEPGNCNPVGRDVLRKNGKLRILAPDESEKTDLEFKFTSTESEFKQFFPN